MRAAQFLCLTVLSAALAGPAAAQAVSLTVDQTHPLRTTTPVTGVVVGNASIADVIVHDPRTLFIMGKSVGTTQILAVDARGRTVYSANVQVRAGSESNLLTVQRGRETSTAICDERCVEVAHPEATQAPMSQAISRAKARSGFSQGGG
jgi:Flp pilus assembly secretin CpaC